ncbi:hypothetical protein ACFQE1_13955, partial [Halobium palmae]
MSTVSGCTFRESGGGVLIMLARGSVERIADGARCDGSNASGSSTARSRTGPPHGAVTPSPADSLVPFGHSLTPRATPFGHSLTPRATPFGHERP